MKIHYILTVIFASLALSSCISDDSTEGTNILPTLTIAESKTTDMPVLNFNLGEDCVITPELAYNGTDTLTYNWYVGTYKDGVKGKLERVSGQRNLNYKFLSGGSYYAHFTVSDGKVGAVADYQININRTFENGYLLVSNDEAGKSNLAFVKIMTPEEIKAGTPQITMEHVIERMNSDIKPGSLIGAIHGTIVWPKKIHRVLASTADQCYFFDPNTFTITSSLNYNNVKAGFKASSFHPDSYSPFVYDNQQKQFIHMNLQYMFGYEYGSFKGLTFDDCYQNTYAAWGSTYYITLFVDYATSEVKEMDFNTGSFISTGKRLAGQDIMSAFITEIKEYIPHELILTRSKTDLSQWFLHEYEGIPYLADDNMGNITQIKTTDQTAVPTQKTRFAFSAKNNRYFYPVGNAIYVFLPSSTTPMPDKNQWAISFAQDEIVTYMDVNATTDELYVATYSSSSHRGSFYIFNCSDIKTDHQGNIKPTAAHKNVADRISQIIYKPSL